MIIKYLVNIEVKDALKISNNKSAGLDDIPHEFYKNGGECVVEKM